MKLKNVAALYMQSPQWGDLSLKSQEIYRAQLKNLEPLFDVPIDQITRPKVIDLKDKLYDKSATCRLVMVLLRNILSFAYDRGMCEYNHAVGIRHMPKSVPIKRWSEAECTRFLKSAPRQLRTAFLLALYTGQRRSDLIRMKWDQYDGRYISIIQKKTKRVLKIPVHAELKKELDAILENTDPVARGLYILVNTFRKPWSEVGLTTAIRRHCDREGIADRSLHGLRKTTAAKLAELGCSPHLIGAITGHRSLKELAHYTDEADQVRMADEAIRKWENEDA